MKIKFPLLLTLCALAPSCDKDHNLCESNSSYIDVESLSVYKFDIDRRLGKLTVLPESGKESPFQMIINISGDTMTVEQLFSIPDDVKPGKSWKTALMICSATNLSGNSPHDTFLIRCQTSDGRRDSTSVYNPDKGIIALRWHGAAGIDGNPFDYKLALISAQGMGYNCN